MIFGNPDRFSLSWDLVNEWDTQQPRFYEGLLFVYVNGRVIPWENLGSVDIWRNLGEFNRALKMHEIQKISDIFFGDDLLVYERLLNYTFNDDLSNWEYRADSEAISDHGIFIFLVKRPDEEVIYVGIGGEFLTSVVLKLGEFAAVVEKSTKYFFEKYPEALLKKPFAE